MLKYDCCLDFGSCSSWGVFKILNHLSVGKLSCCRGKIMFSAGNFSIVPDDLFAFFVKHGDVSAKLSYSGGPFHNFWKIRGLFCKKRPGALFTTVLVVVQFSER